MSYEPQRIAAPRRGYGSDSCEWFAKGTRPLPRHRWREGGGPVRRNLRPDLFMQKNP